MIERGKQAAKTFKQYQRLTDSPSERIQTLLKNMLLNPTLPNITLGGALVATLQYAFEMVPLWFMLGSWAVWVASVVIFAIGEEIVYAFKAAKADEEEANHGCYRDDVYQ